MDQKIKVMHLVGGMELGGVSKLVKYDVENSHREVFDVQVCCLGILGEYGLELQEKGYSIKAFGLSRSWKQPIKNLISLMNTFTYLKYQDIHILNAHLFVPGIIGRIFGKLLRIPGVIHTTHNIMYPRWEPFFNRLLERFTSRVIVDSYAVKKKLIGAGQTDQLITVIYNGIDENEFAPTSDVSEVREGLNISPDDIVLGNISGLQFYKGHDFLLDVFAKLSLTHKHIHLMLIGDGEEKNSLAHKARGLKIESKVHFLGRRTNIPPLIRSMDIMVHPSRWEGFGIILAEAMYCGIPVVASDRGGIPEVVEGKKCGYTHPFGDTDAFVDSISKLILDQELRARLGANGKSRVKRMFTVETMMQAYSKTYKEIIRAL
jgi:glycosyltransferase involved in cell wall biosynthesis